MNVEDIRSYCLAKKGTTECMPFDDNCLVFKVMNKMFALVTLSNDKHLCLKCDPDYALDLREEYSCIEGAYHFNKKYWNQILLKGEISDTLVQQLIDHSLEETLKKMTKKEQKEYEGL